MRRAARLLMVVVCACAAGLLAPLGAPTSVATAATAPLYRSVQELAIPANSGGSVVVADFTGDGRADVAASYQDEIDADGVHPGTGGVQVFGRGSSGKFALKQWIRRNYVFYSLAVGDFDDNHRADLAAMTRSPEEWAVRIFEQRSGTLRLTDSLSLPIDQSTGVTTSGSDVAVADVNRDGRSDVVIGSNLGDYVAYRWRSGFGRWHRVPGMPTDQSGGNDEDLVFVTDVNGDHRPDIVSAVWNRFVVSRQRAAGGFATGKTVVQVNVAQNHAYFLGKWVGDATGEGRPDLLATRNFSGDSYLYVWRGHGDGTFGPQAHRYPIYAPADAPSLRVARMTAGSRPSVFEIHNGYQSIGMLPDRADGTLGAERKFGTRGYPNELMRGIAVGYLNGDRSKDLAIDDGAQVEIFLHR